MHALYSEEIDEMVTVQGQNEDGAVKDIKETCEEMKSSNSISELAIVYMHACMHALW